MLTNNRAKRAFDLINEGVTGDELVQKLCQEFSLAGYGADQAIKEAMAEINMLRSREVKESDDLADHIKRREEIYETAIAKNDEELALKALNDLAKLKGIYDQAKDNEVKIEFMFPDVIGYKPLTRDEMERMRKMMKREELDKIEAHIEPGADIDTGEKELAIEGSNTI